jgi:hypothetical protein
MRTLAVVGRRGGIAVASIAMYPALHSIGRVRRMVDVYKRGLAELQESSRTRL